mgnify:CR=1 FL=1
MRKVKLTKESTKDILETLLKRSPNNYGKYEDAVADILAKVKAEGDEALFAFTREFDKVEVTKETIRVTPEEIEEAYKLVDPSLIDVIKKALVNIRSYHEKQLQNSWFTSTTDGTMLGQKVTALNRVGVYVPGGKAVYPSSVLMNIVPAKVAGVDRIVMTTPPGKDGKVYYYAMNGQTGTINGDFPFERKKALLTSVVSALFVLIFMLVGGYFS